MGRGTGGGWASAPPHPWPLVQCFDPQEDHWSLRSPMPLSQRCLEAVSLEDTIYMVGGLMGTVFTYSPGTDVLGEAAVLPSPVLSGGSQVQSCNGSAQQREGPLLRIWVLEIVLCLTPR